MTLPAGEPEVVEAQVAFHLQAGVDEILLLEPPEEGRQALEPHLRGGRVRVVPRPRDPGGDGAAHLARVAVAEHGPAWLLECGPGEFWWPRGESIGVILAAIPERYTVVQALVRQFVPGGEHGSHAGRAVIRRALRPDGSRAPGELLRSIRRSQGEWPVPLRGWYPVEVLRLPAQDAPVLGEAELRRGLEDGSLVEDDRLGAALEALASGEGLRFPTPGVVDDALYAADCAAVGEVTAESLEQRVEELEVQLARLEARLWTRVGRRLSRRRPG